MSNLCVTIVCDSCFMYTACFVIKFWAHYISLWGCISIRQSICLPAFVSHYGYPSVYSVVLVHIEWPYGGALQSRLFVVYRHIIEETNIFIFLTFTFTFVYGPRLCMAHISITDSIFPLHIGRKYWGAV